VGFEIQRTEPAPPGADGVLTDTQVAGDPRVGLAPPRRQHDLGAQHQTLRRAGPGHDRFPASSTALTPKTMTPSLQPVPPDLPNTPDMIKGVKGPEKVITSGPDTEQALGCALGLYLAAPTTWINPSKD
jgi:hypothetical protein